MIKRLCRGFEKIANISLEEGREVVLRGRVQASRLKGNLGFLVLRQQLESIQCCFMKGEGFDKVMLKKLGSLPNESIVDIYGKLALTSSPTACSVNNYEIKVTSFNIISKAIQVLPFQYEEGLSLERVQLKTRLDSRVMDLRLPLNIILFQMSSQICEEFRSFLISKRFLEVHSPKIIQGVSEGGSEVFITDYFGKKACLAQSPQLYKQMAILGDLERVFEVGPVFRAENSNTHRHLCEFTGLDLEMAIDSSYIEVISLVYEMILHVIYRLKNNKNIEYVYQMFNSEEFLVPKDMILVSFAQACDLLKSEGVVQAYNEDFSMETEKALGKIIRKRYNSDLFVVHKYPRNARPFYTMVCDNDSEYTCSFDIFMRGEEIASGSQRVHDYELLKKSAENRVNIESIESYLDSFKYGAFPHGGCGLGLERLLMLFTGLNNIRLASLFPRDPKRLTP